MILCFISPFAYRLFYPDEASAPFFGGAEVQQYQLAHALARDSDFSVHCIIGSLKRRIIPSLPDIHDGVRVHQAVRIASRVPLLDTILDFLYVSVVLFRMRPHIIVVRGGGVLAGKIAFIARVFLHTHFIFSSMHDRESSAAYWQSMSVYKRLLFHYAIRSADVVICQHREQQKGFENYFGCTALILPTLYPIGTEEDIIPYAERAYVLWVGRLQDWKQPEIFLELARAHPHERFVLVTPGDATHFKSLAAGLTVVTVVGPVPFHSIDHYFRYAKVFINTSRFEGFPNTFVQAAKNGTPILSLSVNPNHMLETHRMGRSAAGDYHRLSYNLAEFLNNEALWHNASRNAYRYAAQHHDIRSIAAHYKNIFMSLCV